MDLRPRAPLLVLCVVGFFLPLNAAAQEAFLGSWAGSLKVGSTELRIVFHIERDDGGLAATMDSPDQGATGIPVSNVRVAGDSVTLSVTRLNGRYEGVLVSDEARIDGTWTQSGRSFPLSLTPATEADTTLPPRPQHPEPPYPYRQEEVTFRNWLAGINLSGTLTRPKGEGPWPAVVLVSGSGPQDRNSEVMGHKLFLVLADHLTRQGIAVLRYDERGVGDSEGIFMEATSRDFAYDVAAAVRFLKKRPTIDSTEVGLVGMSEGGLVAPMVHVREEPVAFLVLMAAPGVPGSEILVKQTVAIAEAQGASASVVDSLRARQRRVMEVVRTASDSAAIAEQVRPILGKRGESDEQIQSRIRRVTGPWFRYFVRYDPAPVLRQVDVPILVLYGSNDLQVLPEQNVEPVRSALEDSPSEDVTVRVLDGLSHSFQPDDTGLPGRYGEIDTTIAPKALEAITDWIRTRASTVE